jgi:phosphoribosylglycinamide formyltransferase 1
LRPIALRRIAVLISGRGSNLAALLDAERAGTLGGTVCAVISNRPDAAGLDIARRRGIATRVLDHRGFASREAFDAALDEALTASAADLIVLAGFMRVLGRELVERYRERMLNIHPSLLPLYGGLHTHRRALADGVRIHGCTVHFVTADLDHGPIVAQGAVGVRGDDDPASLAARVLAVEHRLLPAAVRAFCDGRLSIDGARVQVDGEAATEAALEVPPIAD